MEDYTHRHTRTHITAGKQKEDSSKYWRGTIQPLNQRGKCVTVERGGHRAIIWNSRAFLESLHRKPWTFYESRALEEKTETKDDVRERGLN